MLDPDDAEIKDELGPEIVGMLTAQREDFRGRRFRYKVKGITGMIERNRRIRNLLNFLTVSSGNEMLMQVLLDKFSGAKIMDRLIRDFGIDPGELEKTEQERMLDAMKAARSQGLMGGGAPGAPGAPGPAGRRGSPPKPPQIPSGVPQ